MPWWFVVSLFVALVACGAPGARSPSPVPVAPAATRRSERPDTAALTRDIPDLLRVSDVPGLSIAVVGRGGVIWAGAFGTVNTETIFEAASLSKPVFAYVVLRLADRGEFDLDRPLVEMLEYPRLRNERSQRITARMVLSHGTGLPNWGGERLTLRFEPGTGYAYSGEGFVYLQKVIERVTATPLDELARREVFQPLGMTRSSFVWQERFAGNAAYAKDWFWRDAPVHRYVEANAAASLLTTATDYGRFVAAILNGRGLSPAMWREFTTPVRESSPGIHIGLGIRIEDGPAGRTFHHSGNNGRRFTSYMAGDVARGLGVVYFANAYNGTSLVGALTTRVFGDDRPARHRAGYDRHDDPRLLAVRSVQRAAVDSGPDAARTRLRAIAASAGARLSFDDTLHFGAFFAGRDLSSLAIELLTRAVSDAPDSARAHLALGRAFESAGDLQSAIASYRRAAALEPGAGDAGRQIQWTAERMAARSRAVTVSRETLQRYAGRYQERVITIRDDGLYYRRGANPESRLVPLAEDLFEIERNPALRVRFIEDGAGPARRLVEIDSEGTIDESVRSR